MTSTPDKLKQEPPNDDITMSGDGDTPRENGDSSGLSNQADGSQPGQSDMNQVGQNNGNQPGQTDMNQTGQSNDNQPGQTDMNQAAGQSNDNQTGQNNGNQSSNENPFLARPFKRSLQKPDDRGNSADNSRAFSPAVEDPNAKKAKTDHVFSFNSAKAKTAPFSPRAQTTTRASPFSDDDGVGDPDLEKDLVG
ncbi:uncharacterized protein BKA55DRAFT_494481, partial [Fusarium redolens]